METPGFDVLISCGKKKRDKPVPARDLYIGGYSNALRGLADTFKARPYYYVTPSGGGLWLESATVAPYDILTPRKTLRTQEFQDKVRAESYAKYPHLWASKDPIWHLGSVNNFEFTQALFKGYREVHQAVVDGGRMGFFISMAKMITGRDKPLQCLQGAELGDNLYLFQFRLGKHDYSGLFQQVAGIYKIVQHLTQKEIRANSELAILQMRMAHPNLPLDIYAVHRKKLAGPLKEIMVQYAMERGLL